MEKLSKKHHMGFIRQKHLMAYQASLNLP